MRESENETQKELFEEIKKEKKMKKDFLRFHRSEKKNGDFPYIDADEFEKKAIKMEDNHSDDYYEKIFLKLLKKFGE